jgi:hypothetical protein
MLMVIGPVASGEPGDGADDGRPPVWRGQTGVVGVQVAFDPEPFLPVTDLVNVALPEGITEWDPTGARARAGPLWPGGFVTGFPNLLLPLVIGSEAPPYPGAAEAQHPDVPDASVAGGLASAHASRSHVESRATYQPSDVPAHQPGVIEVGSVTTLTRQHWEDDVLVSYAQALVTDITIVEQIRIDSVKVTAVARSSVGEVGEASTRVTVSGVSVAGVPAVIDQDGITISGQGDDRAILGGAGSVARQAVELLEELDQAVDIRLVGGAEDVDGGEARAEAAGLLISLTFEIGSPSGSPLPGDAEVLTLANLVYDLMPDDVPQPIPPGPNTVFRKYYTTVSIGQATARAFTDSFTFTGDGLGDLGGLSGGATDLTPGGRLGETGAGGVEVGRPVDDISASVPRAGEADVSDRRGPTSSDGSDRSSVGDPLLLAALPAERLGTVVTIALLTGGLLFGCSRLLARRLIDA